jgi:hypothetical protein
VSPTIILKAQYARTSEQPKIAIANGVKKWAIAENGIKTIIYTDMESSIKASKEKTAGSQASYAIRTPVLPANPISAYELFISLKKKFKESA